MASSLALLSPGAGAQRTDQPDARGEAAPTGPRDTRLETRRSGTGRDQFIAPVMGIQIEGDGLNLPPEAPDEDAKKPPAKPAEETKEPEPRSTK